MDKENILSNFQEKAKNAAPIGGTIKFEIDGNSASKLLELADSGLSPLQFIEEHKLKTNDQHFVVQKNYQMDLLFFHRDYYLLKHH